MIGTPVDDIPNTTDMHRACHTPVFSEAPGKDACVVSVDATKVVALDPSESGVDGEIIPVGGHTD
jgi:hypothetical protein